MKVRLNLYIDHDVATELGTMARKPGANRSRVVSYLLRRALDQEASAGLGDRLKLRLDAMSRDIKASNRVDNVLLEAVMLLVRHMLTILPSAVDDPVAVARGAKRFEAFIDELGRELATKGILEAALSPREPNASDREVLR